jgi:hypothetical protein
MQVNLHHSVIANSGSRAEVSIRPSDAKNPQSELVLHVATPKTSSTFGRRLLNTLTLGIYTKHVSNPAQWRAFRNAMVADLRNADPGMDAANAKGTVQRLLLGYNPHKRLTAAKIQNALADLERLKAGQSPWAADRQRANASQSALARGINTLRELNRDLNVREQGLKTHAEQVQKTYSEAPMNDRLSKPSLDDVSFSRRQGTQASDGFEDVAEERFLPDMNPADIARKEAAKAMLSVLRPGRQIDGMALNQGMAALTQYAAKKQVSFLAVPQDTYQPNAEQRAREAIDALAKAHPKPALVAIPFGLMAPRSSTLHEPHSVLIALDMQHQKVLYLDAKGQSIEHAMKTYSNADNLKAHLNALGRAAFGSNWNQETGVQQLTQAKQQGANDCVAFTHDFTRQLIDGKSVGDIERTMTAADRREVRLRMAQDIDHFLLDGPAPARSL